MSLRWKIQLGYGLAFALLMLLLNNATNYAISPELVGWKTLALQFIFNFLGGTFILGYLHWRFTNRKPKKQ